jgi:hypothetical protein
MAPAWKRAGVLPAGKVQLVPIGVPTVRPTTTSGFNVPFGKVSTADVRVNVTIPPPCPTVKLLNTLWGTPFTAAGTVPLNVELLVIGDVVGDVLELLSQAAVVRTITSETGAKCPRDITSSPGEGFYGVRITTVYATGPDVDEASSLVTWRHHVPGLSVPEIGEALAERS